MDRWKQLYERHRIVVLGVGSTFLMILFLILLLDWVIMPLYTHHGAEEELPDVTEHSFVEAEKILEAKGFRIVNDGEKYNATYPESTVIFQNPAPYSTVKKGRRIYVTLSAGERRVRVPRIIGASERDAEFTLKQAGLVLGEAFYEYSNYYPAGVVSDQSLPEETEVVEETPVDITVSLGRLPTRFVVPDVVGKSLDTAKRMIRRAGLRVGDISYEIQESLIPETVIRQSVEPDEEVYRGQPIDLVVSRLEEETWEAL